MAQARALLESALAARGPTGRGAAHGILLLESAAFCAQARDRTHGEALEAARKQAEQEVAHHEALLEQRLAAAARETAEASSFGIARKFVLKCRIFGTRYLGNPTLRRSLGPSDSSAAGVGRREARGERPQDGEPDAGEPRRR